MARVPLADLPCDPSFVASGTCDIRSLLDVAGR